MMKNAFTQIQDAQKEKKVAEQEAARLRAELDRLNREMEGKILEESTGKILDQKEYYEETIREWSEKCLDLEEEVAEYKLRFQTKATQLEKEQLLTINKVFQKHSDKVKHYNDLKNKLNEGEERYKLMMK